MKTRIAKSDIDEIKTLHTPPRAIPFVLSATMLLLGNEEPIAKSRLKGADPWIVVGEDIYAQNDTSIMGLAIDSMVQGFTVEFTCTQQAKSYRHVRRQLRSAGPQALQTRMSQVNVDLIPAEVAQLARQWQGDLSPEVIMKNTRAAVPFLNWNQEVIESVLARSG